jgi:hypothetical protein
MAIAILLLAALASAPAHADGDGFSDAAQAVAATRAKTTRLAAQAQDSRRAAMSWSPANWQRDLSAQFPDGGGAQGNIGDCHDFSTVSLVDAALRRGTGKQWALSPADLFVQKTILGMAYFGNFIQGGGGPGEGGWESDDAAYVLSRGIAMNISYDRFQAEYTRYRDAHLLPQEKQLLGKLPLLHDKTPDPAAFGARVRIASEMRDNARLKMDEILGKIDPRAAEERAQVKKALRGYHVAVRAFPDVSATDYSGAYGRSELIASEKHALCARHGAGQAYLVRSELDAGRPVAVDLNISGMIHMKADSTQGFLLATKPNMTHAIVIEGYTSEGPGYMYKIRNWWGDASIGVAVVGGRLTTGVLHDDDMCRVFQMTSVLAPGERSALPIVH